MFALDLRMLPTGSIIGLLPSRRPRLSAAMSERMTMGHYKSNLRDIEFNLFEVFG